MTFPPRRPTSAGRRPLVQPVPTTLALLAALAPLGALAAQDTPASGSPSPDSPLRAVALTTNESQLLRLDGRVDEPFWERAAPASGFRQHEPDEGLPATELTEVRVAYDDTGLYIAVRAFDSEPDRVVARLLQRDRVMSGGDFGGPRFAGDDAVAILLDPFDDNRSGVVLATNPNGAQYDALLTDEGSEVNVDWRGVWDVAATRTADGWSAEFSIPWRTLRYPDAATGRPWGFNVFRIIQRKQEEVLWRSWERDGGGFERVSRAGALVGLQDLPRPGLNLEAKPFVLGGRTWDRTEAGDLPGESRWDAGLDLKSELRPGLVLDLTVNTDFAQVEVDDEQVNLTRFDLFFPEKRDFFLENAGVFELGHTGFFGPPPFLMFFSRRIGLDEDGEVPILGGARLTGRVGGQTVGFLNVLTDDAHGREGESFTVARVKRDVGESNYLGAMVTDRRGDGPENTVAGVDGQFYLHPTVTLDAFAARTWTAGEGGDGHAYAATLDFTGDVWGAFAQTITVSPDAVARAGFITRPDIRNSRLTGRRTWRPDALGLRRMDLRLSGDYQSTTEGRFQDVSWGPSLRSTFDSGDNVNLSFDLGDTRVDEAFPVAGRVDVPAGRYSTDEWSVQVNSSDARPWSVEARLRGADFFGGDLLASSVEAGVTPTPAFSFSAGLARNDVDLPGGSFVSDIYSFRVTWALSTLVTTNALVQYDTLDDEVLTNVRFNFIHRPGSDLYVVFTEDRGVDGELERVGNRGLVVKATYLVRF